MLTNRGKVLELIAKSSDISVSALARKMEYNRATVYRHFETEDLDFSILRRYGTALKHDFSIEFPEMIQLSGFVEEPLTAYKASTISEVLQERDYWKDKYLALLERHNLLIMQQLEDKK